MNILHTDINVFKRLWVHVIIQAKTDLYGKKITSTNTSDISRKQNRELNRIQAFNWFKNKVNKEIGSFIWICDILNYDSSKLCKKIISKGGTWKQQIV